MNVFKKVLDELWFKPNLALILLLMIIIFMILGAFRYGFQKRDFSKQIIVFRFIVKMVGQPGFELFQDFLDLSGFSALEAEALTEEHKNCDSLQPG